jgi:quinol-cytochrome oxidoreductase complex cytochrome b subunit
MLAASFTGYLLPWDQLGLWAVRVGTDLKGYRPAFGSQARFVVIGGSEISKSMLWRRFVIHTAVLSGLLVALLTVAFRLRPRHGRRSPTPLPLPVPGPKS